MERYETIKDATFAFVREFNAFPDTMIKKLMSVDPDKWYDVTTPAIGDRAYCFDADSSGEIIKILKDNTGAKFYEVCLDSGEEINCGLNELETETHGALPMWGTMWQFDDWCDDYWLEEEDGVEVMSELGFKIWFSEEFGYFFGIDGAGYDFYEAHWIPLYKARGLKWHSEASEQKYQMERKGYTIGKIGTSEYWMDGNKVIEEVIQDE